MSDKLTGRTRFRADKLAKLVFQVQTIVVTNIAKAKFPPMWVNAEVWRDARVEDLAELHSLHYSRIELRLPDAPPPGEPELIGEHPIKPRKPH